MRFSFPQCHFALSCRWLLAFFLCLCVPVATAACPLALLGSAFYPVLVHRLADSLHASSPHSVPLM
jgi:hypothetical protein